MARTQLHSQDWYRVADMRPKLRPQIEVSLHDYLGRDWFVLFDRSSGKSVRLPGEDFTILRRFDGNTTIDQVWNDLAWSGGANLPPQDEFIELLSRLYEGGVIAMDALPRTATLARTQVKLGREWITRFLRSPVSQKVPLANPSALLRQPWVEALANLIFSRFGLVVWVGLVLAAALTASEVWTPLTANLADRALAPSNLIILAAVYPFVKLVHEAAHALAVRRYGGDVTQVGVMFLVFVPMPFVDASEANRFRSHSARAIVTLAGIMAEFAIGAIALLLWSQSDPGLWRAVLFNTIFICTVSTLLFNGNPLLRFDAYYALADITQTPGLGTRGQKLLGRFFKGVFGIAKGPDTETAETSARVWMASYAVAAAIYRVIITFSIALIVAGMIPYVGQILAVWVVVGGLLWPNIKSAYDLLKSPQVSENRQRVGLRIGVAAVMLVAFLGFFPMPSRSTVVGMVANDDSAAVFTEVEGKLQEMHVVGGQFLQVSDRIVTLRPERLEVEADAISSRILASTAKLRQSGQTGGAGLTEAIRRELSALTESENALIFRLEAASVRAGRSGEWMPETPEIHLGQHITRGQRIGWIDAADNRRIVAALPQNVRRSMNRGITGAKILLAPGRIVYIGAQAITVRPNATRRLDDDRLADRFGGPVLTEPTDDVQGYRAVSPVYPMEVQMDLSSERVGQLVQVKLMHPSEPLAAQIWPRIVAIIADRFGPGGG
ncbi:MAG: putative peptide zinc metalloprotease protein [Sulfitobacter sp.]|jgi:putative peptide zinc metalloprotease protein